jgi:phospholipid/cholesterol/gamma-HCH transport system substrate-binding protein
MKISKEVRIGILVSVAILMFFIGFNFLKNASVFSSDKEYYSYYQNVDGLQNSAVVMLRGMNVGHVTEMELVAGRGVKVTMSISKKIDVPVGTIADLVSTDLLGTKNISLDPGNGPGSLPTKSEINSDKPGGMVDNVTTELTPRLRELKTTIRALDSTLGYVNSIVGPENKKIITDALNSIKITADNLAALTGALKTEGTEITSILHNANSFMGNLAKSNDTITNLLSHLNNFSASLEKAPITKAVTDLQGAVAGLNAIVEKVNKSEGSLGLLINNKDVYNNLNATLGSVNALMADLKAHPGRYINVNLIGGKKKD